jgi:hypothetical protein
MIDDDIQNADPDAELIANQELPSQEKLSTEQPAEQPIASQPEPAWKAKYKSPDDMWDETRKFMSEKQRLENENLRLRQQIPQPPPVDPAVARDKRLEQFIQDPDAVINDAAMKLMGPIAKKVVLGEYFNEHPEAKPYRATIDAMIESQPNILSIPNAIHAVYLLAKDEDASGKAVEAQKIVADNRAAIQESKKTGAYVEPATQPKRSAPPTLKSGMSIAESQKALDEAGIGWNPEDKYSGG